MSTKFFYGKAFEALGFQQQVTQLLSSLGWARFITYRDYTYKRLTLEFLATLETNSTPSDPNDQFSNTNITMTFRMFNQQHTLSLDKLNTIPGWPTDVEYGPMGFCEISGEESFNSRANRFIAIASGEVFKSAIVSSGMITIIARALGHGSNVDSDSRGPVDKDILIDLGAIRSMEFFQENRAMRLPFKWLVRGMEWMMTKRSTINEAGPSATPHRNSTSSVPSSEMQMILEHMSSMHVQQQQTMECALGLHSDMDVLNRVA
ncbi:Catalase-peroxidase [Bienertia sinuspersici]